MLNYHVMPMKKRFIILSLLCAAAIRPVFAQDVKQSFEEFRQSLRKDYADFRQSLLDNYDKYLEGIWNEYNAFRGVQRDTVPKPVESPVAPKDNEPPLVRESDPVSVGDPIPDTIAEPVIQEPVRRPVVTPPEATDNAFDFYGIRVTVPVADVGMCPDRIATNEYATLWRQFKRKGIDSRIVPALRQAASSYKLNDWFTFQLVRTYVASHYASSSVPLRVGLTHFLLCHLGYNVRLGQDKADRPLLLVAFKQMVYAHTYSELNGQRFYVYYDMQAEREGAELLPFYTCELPADVSAGRPVDLLLTEAPLVPYKTHHFRIGVDRLTVSGELNANLMPMIYRYPQMDVECYAYSMLCPDVRRTVVTQLREQLQGLPQLQAVNSLLQFVQYAFEYAKDPEQHGFEKPYFFEELLFYPKCDCEDRSVFYSYLLWEVLGVENQLVFFPGHACVAVRLDESVNGTSYRYEGHDFYISDPTYIGSVTGECMPAYLNTRPVTALSR